MAEESCDAKGQGHEKRSKWEPNGVWSIAFPTEIGTYHTLNAMVVMAKLRHKLVMRVNCHIAVL